MRAPRSISRSIEPSAESRGQPEPSAAEPAGSLIVGTIRGPHGVRGEVRIFSETDVLGRFAVGGVLECAGIGPLTIASARGAASDPIVRFKGYDSRSASEVLRGRVLRVSRTSARAATQGGYLWADLIGLRVVTPEGVPLGEVGEVLRAGGADVLVVRGERELLLPMIASVVRAIDLAGGCIEAVPQEEA